MKSDLCLRKVTFMLGCHDNEPLFKEEANYDGENHSTKNEGYQPLSLHHSPAHHLRPSLPFPRPQISQMKIMGLMSTNDLIYDTKFPYRPQVLCGQMKD